MPHWHLFERYGVELEYMIVDTGSLQVRPIADKIVHAIGAERKNEVKHGKLRWSNELVLHVIELKTDGPAKRLDGLAEDFQTEVAYLNDLLGEYACMLLPTAMHPWMDPLKETRLWPHGDQSIYNTFDRIFNCKGHGWSNLQSTHLNLPFNGDEEFHRLHSAIRLVLPLLPALAASSPIIEGKVGSHLDMRLEAYRNNCARIPSITGLVVPEAVSSKAAYQSSILDPIYTDLAPHDPDEILRDEWVNARGAIARFSRGTVEIRVLDIQECPAMDLALLQGIVALLRAVVQEQWSPLSHYSKLPTDVLAELFNDSSREGAAARISHPELLAAFGKSKSRNLTVGTLLEELFADVCPEHASWRGPIELILNRGNLSQRILRATGSDPSRNQLRTVYEKLASCLAAGDPFTA